MTMMFRDVVNGFCKARRAKIYEDVVLYSLGSVLQSTGYFNFFNFEQENIISNQAFFN